MSTIRDFLVTQEIAIQATGTSEGAEKAWDERGRGKASEPVVVESKEMLTKQLADWTRERETTKNPTQRDKADRRIKQLAKKLKAIQGAGGGASGGSGGGPAPDRQIPAKGASLVGSQFNPPLTDQASYNVPDSGNMHSKGGKIKELDVDSTEDASGEK
jgi:hypothetical protein